MCGLQMGCGRGAEDAQCAKCVQSPHTGLVSCLSHLHAQLIVPNASQNLQVSYVSGLLDYLGLLQKKGH